MEKIKLKLRLNSNKDLLVERILYLNIRTRLAIVRICHQSK